MPEELPTPDSEERARAIVAGKVIEGLRLRRQWSQADLARQVRVGQATISRLESGNLLRPDAFLFRNLAAVFAMTTEQLHEHIDRVMLESKRLSKVKGDEWWSALAAVALGGLALFVILSILDGGGGKGPKPG